MKKRCSILLAACLMIAALTGCSQTQTVEQTSAQTTEVQQTEETQQEKEVQTFSIGYPSYLQESQGEALVLEEKPEDIVVLSNSALQILVACGIEPVAVTSPHVQIDYPDWVRELPVISTGMSDLDSESVISMQPDLVIMGVHLKEDYGQQFQDAGIPVYYTSEGPSITYQEVKEEAITLTESFGTKEQLEKMKSDFAEVEQRAADFREKWDSKQMMILFGAPPSYQQTSKGYLGSILAMLPFKNMADQVLSEDSRTAPLDLESLLEVNPEILFAISPTAQSAEDLQAVYAEEFEKNPKIWSSLQAVKNDQVIWLSNEYVTSKGVHIIQSIHSLIDMLEEKFAVN